jgi:hypothetical protein
VRYNRSKALIGGFVTVLVCFIGYAVFFTHLLTREEQWGTYGQDKQQLEKSLTYLKNKDYENAKKAVFVDSVYFIYEVQSDRIKQEHIVYDYAMFMTTPDNDPIVKFSYAQFLKPIEGIVTQEQINQFITEWKPKSEDVSASIQKQTDEALSGLSQEEKSFVLKYVNDPYNDNHDPDPIRAAYSVIDKATLLKAKKQAETWMNDSRILQAIEKYKKSINRIK